MFPQVRRPKNRIYLDYAATTPVDKQVLLAMNPFWQKDFGNPSALYEEGKEAGQAVELSRKKISEILHCRPQEIIFTAGGTESVNLAVLGLARNLREQGKGKPHIITSKIEHHAVLNSCAKLAKEGFAVTYIGVDAQGFVDLGELKKSIRPETVLVSIMYANNEIGSIQPIAAIGKIIRGENLKRDLNKLPGIVFHTDASQAAGALDLNVEKLNVDLLSLNGSKIYGPKQTGLLYAKTGITLQPVIYGGGQEKNLRSGTENVPGIVGLSKALELAQRQRGKENVRLAKLQTYFYNQIAKKIGRVFLNGPDLNPNEGLRRLPNNLNVSFLGVEGESLLLYLDSYGISVATGSACASASMDPSHVLVALDIPSEQINSSVRFTFGRNTTKQKLDYVLKVLPGIVEELRKM